MKEKCIGLDPKRQDALMNAAFREFASNGFEDASTNKIAQNAGISKALMFHYVGCKKELFQMLCDTCLTLLSTEYLARVDLSETDVLARLRSVFLAKTDLMAKYPWIFEFVKTVAHMKPEATGGEKGTTFRQLQEESAKALFTGIDISLFRAGLDTERFKSLIFWGLTGFCDQMTAALLETGYGPDREAVMCELDLYLDELRKALYS